MAYATWSDVDGWLPASVDQPDDEDERARLLDRASEHVDSLLLAAIYDVDANDDPTDADVIAALRDATCAVLELWLTTDDEGVGEVYDQVRIGSVALQRTAGAGQSSSGRSLPARALQILQRAGLLPGVTST